MRSGIWGGCGSACPGCQRITAPAAAVEGCGWQYSNTDVTGTSAGFIQYLTVKNVRLFVVFVLMNFLSTPLPVWLPINALVCIKPHLESAVKSLSGCLYLKGSQDGRILFEFHPTAPFRISTAQCTADQVHSPIVRLPAVVLPLLVVLAALVLYHQVPPLPVTEGSGGPGSGGNVYSMTSSTQGLLRGGRLPLDNEESEDEEVLAHRRV